MRRRWLGQKQLHQTGRRYLMWQLPHGQVWRLQEQLQQRLGQVQRVQQVQQVQQQGQQGQQQGQQGQQQDQVQVRDKVWLVWRLQLILGSGSAGAGLSTSFSRGNVPLVTSRDEYMTVRRRTGAKPPLYRTVSDDHTGKDKLEDVKDRMVGSCEQDTPITDMADIPQCPVCLQPPPDTALLSNCSHVFCGACL